MRVGLEREADAPGWRATARALALAGIPPEAVDWQGGEDLFGSADPLPEPRPDAAPLMVPKGFPALIEAAICHSDPGRFDLLYRLLIRLQSEPGLLEILPDPDVQRLHRLVKAVNCDVHKMHAFVRFRELPGDGRRRFAAWFEPDHHIVARAAPFFARRFADMDWLILTPRGQAAFCDGALQASETPAEKPALEDPTEDLWRTYYASIFNPARLKLQAMRSEMPRKYWKNLPEAGLIPGLVAGAGARVAGMAPDRRAPPAFHAALHARRPEPAPLPAGDWERLRAEAEACTRCGLADHATQTVLGEGPRDAALMILGEQPGDLEDLAGRPFVGPAGQVLDRGLALAGIDRGAAYLTNAVKHFKFLPRGKRRVHQRPNAGEVTHCRWWLQSELALLRPRLVLAMGATAVQGLTGRAPRMAEIRGRILPLADGVAMLPTWHPAYLLRLPDREAAEAETAHFHADLRRAAEFLNAA